MSFGNPISRSTMAGMNSSIAPKRYAPTMAPPRLATPT